MTQREYVRVMRAARRRLVAAGIEDMSLRGNHLLLSIDREQKLAVDDRNMPLMRICNFELLRKIGDCTVSKKDHSDKSRQGAGRRLTIRT